MVVPSPDGACVSKSAGTWKVREKRGRRVSPPPVETCLGRRGRLRPPAAPRDRVTGQFAGAVVAQIGLLRAAPRIGIGQTQRRTFVVADFLAAVVADEHSLTGQGFLLYGTRTR